MKSHLALYRKYRPETFSDVVGQEHIVTLLTTSIKQKKISHAYLFCGGRGTGKTTVARIVAKDIGCNPEDIIEIDAASNRGIDEIRALRDAVRTSPFSSPYKVYIIDEAHMLTKEAANALLKTLEEPPSHVIFILATTDPEKLPQTIVSRCQKIVFQNPSRETLALHLMNIALEEGFKLDNKTALTIASHGKGSFRDSLGILEQVISTSGKTIVYEDVTHLLGTPEKEALIILLGAVCTKNQKTVVETIHVLSSKTDSLRAYDEFIELVQQALYIRIGEGKKGDSKEDTELIRLASEYPRVIASKLVLELLSKRHLLEVSTSHASLAFTAILLSLIED